MSPEELDRISVQWMRTPQVETLGDVAAALGANTTTAELVRVAIELAHLSRNRPPISPVGGESSRLVRYVRAYQLFDRSAFDESAQAAAAGLQGAGPDPFLITLHAAARVAAGQPGASRPLWEITRESTTPTEILLLAARAWWYGGTDADDAQSLLEVSQRLERAAVGIEHASDGESEAVLEPVLAATAAFYIAVALRMLHRYEEALGALGRCFGSLSKLGRASVPDAVVEEARTLYGQARRERDTVRAGQWIAQERARGALSQAEGGVEVQLLRGLSNAPAQGHTGVHEIPVFESDSSALARLSGIWEVPEEFRDEEGYEPPGSSLDEQLSPILQGIWVGAGVGVLLWIAAALVLVAPLGAASVLGYGFGTLAAAGLGAGLAMILGWMRAIGAGQPSFALGFPLMGTCALVCARILTHADGPVPATALVGQLALGGAAQLGGWWWCSKGIHARAGRRRRG